MFDITGLAWEYATREFHVTMTIDEQHELNSFLCSVLSWLLTKGIYH